MLFHRQEIKRIIFKVREIEKVHTMMLREGKGKKQGVERGSFTTAQVTTQNLYFTVTGAIDG